MIFCVVFLWLKFQTHFCVRCHTKIRVCPTKQFFPTRKVLYILAGMKLDRPDVIHLDDPEESRHVLIKS